MRKDIRLVLRGLVTAGLCAAGLSAWADQTPPGFDCVITPSQTVDLGSPQSGQIDAVLVDRSDPVTAGQVVASLESRLEQANLAIAQYKASSENELGLRQAALNIDSRSEERLTSLAASKVASAQDRDRAARDARLSAWRMKIAEDDRQLDILEQARAETALDRRKIRSPIDGVVVKRMHNPGEYIEDQALLRIARLDPLHVEAILPMRLFGKIRPGSPADVMSELDDFRNLAATVERVDAIGDAASGTFGVRLSLPNPDQLIPAGLKCRVIIDHGGSLLSNDRAVGERGARLAVSNGR